MLIDADLRRGVLHNFFGEQNESGWIDLLLNKATVQQVIKKTRFDNLDFITTGDKHIKNYLSTLSSSHARNIFETLKAQYDIIIVDTPPVLSTSDAGEIFQLTDVNLMVFSFQQHNPKVIQATMQKMKNVNVTIDGFLFNRIKETGSGYYGYYGYYGFKYKYQYRYGVKD